MPPRVKTTGVAAEAVRVTRSRARAATASTVAALPTETETVVETQTLVVAEPPTKKRRVATPKKAPAAPKAKTPKAATNAKTKAKAEPLAAPAPRLTPPPPFSLPEAIAHLSAVDRRFASLFERIPCRPFIEAADGESAAGAGAAVALATAAAADAPEPVNGAKDMKDKGPVELVQRKMDPFRTLATSIIGQQVSWMAAKSITRRFVEYFCGPVGEVESRKDQGPFPTREQVAKADVAGLKSVGCSTRKAEYCEWRREGKDG